MERVNVQLEQLAQSLAPPPEEVATIQEVFQAVQHIVLTLFPMAQVHLFGSTANGLCIANTNDIDVCVELREGGDTKVRFECCCAWTVGPCGKSLRRTGARAA